MKKNTYDIEVPTGKNSEDIIDTLKYWMDSSWFFLHNDIVKEFKKRAKVVKGYRRIKLYFIVKKLVKKGRRFKIYRGIKLYFENLEIYVIIQDLPTTPVYKFLSFYGGFITPEDPERIIFIKPEE